MNQQESKLYGKEAEVCESALEQAIKNTENSEGISKAIIRNLALSLFYDAGTKKSRIARIMVLTLAKDKETTKKTGISKRMVYDFLKTPEFKALKSESHAKRRIGKGRKQSVTRFHMKTSNTLAPTVKQILTEEIEKIRGQKPELPNEEIREIIKQSDSIKDFKPATLRREFATILPVQVHKVDRDKPVQSGVPQYSIDRQQLTKVLIEKLHTMNEVIDWLSGMKRDERKIFEDNLSHSSVYTLALEDKCKNHIAVLIKMMPEDYLNPFLRCTNELTHLIKIFDEKLYNEKDQRRTQTRT